MVVAVGVGGRGALPPPAVAAVPIDDIAQPGGEVHLGREVQLLADLGVVNGVAQVMRLAVRYALDQAPVAAALVKQPAGELEVRQLDAAADVVDPAGPGALPQRLDP